MARCGPAKASDRGDESLWVVMPAYNEEASIGRVLDEWLEVLRCLGTPFRVAAIDDGSTDGTLDLLRERQGRAPELVVIAKSNNGHGQSCVHGYRAALAAGARWIFQIDSDGQCDPAYLPALWEARERHPVVFGYRARRDDGLLRWVASRVVSLTCWVTTGTWVADANVPYRLIRRDALEAVVDRVPPDFHLANVFVAVMLVRGPGIHWVPIRFRARFGGTPSVRLRSFAREGWRLGRQLAASRSALRLP